MFKNRKGVNSNNREKTCFFTGHRHINSLDYKEVSQKLKENIIEAHKNGYDTFISGGAIGFDSLCAQTVISLRELGMNIKLKMVLPCNNQSELWTDEQKTHYNTILKLADVIECKDKHYDASCMRERNQRMVSLSNMGIAYLRHFRSGAGQTVRMAEKNNILIVTL